MTSQRTFDQIRVANPSIDAVDSPDTFAPCKAINARVVYEPLPEQGHVRVTARTEAYELLWGVTASPGMLSQHPVEVAFYDRLVQQARQHLPAQSDASGTESISHVLHRVSQLRKCLDDIEATLTPKKVSDKTEKRAATIVPDVNDAFRMLDAWTSKVEEK